MGCGGHAPALNFGSQLLVLLRLPFPPAPAAQTRGPGDRPPGEPTPPGADRRPGGWRKAVGLVPPRLASRVSRCKRTLAGPSGIGRAEEAQRCADGLGVPGGRGEPSGAACRHEHRPAARSSLRTPLGAGAPRGRWGLSPAHHPRPQGPRGRPGSAQAVAGPPTPRSGLPRCPEGPSEPWLCGRPASEPGGPGRPATRRPPRGWIPAAETGGRTPRRGETWKRPTEAGEVPGTQGRVPRVSTVAHTPLDTQETVPGQGRPGHGSTP